MYFNNEEDERDPFEAFGETDASNDDVTLEEFEQTFEQNFETTTAEDEPAVVEPQREVKVKTGFSWAGFAGGLAALVWIAGAIGGPLSYFGVDAVMAMDSSDASWPDRARVRPGPALLGDGLRAAGEALKARRLTLALTQMTHEQRAFPTETAEASAQRLTNTVKNEIESLNDAVASALNRLAELERSAQRNAALFGEAVAASRSNTEAMTDALKTERDAIVELNGDLKGQTDTMAHSIGRQIRLMREAAGEDGSESRRGRAETHLASFTASATVMGERTAALHQVADKAAAATSHLNGTMTNMLDGLTEATRLTETARKSTEQAVLAANERPALCAKRRALRCMKPSAPRNSSARNRSLCTGSCRRYAGEASRKRRMPLASPRKRAKLRLTATRLRSRSALAALASSLGSS